MDARYDRRRTGAAALAAVATLGGALAMGGCQRGDRETETGDRSGGINNNSNTHMGAAPGPGAPEETRNGARINTGRTAGLTGQQVTSSGASPGAVDPAQVGYGTAGSAAMANGAATSPATVNGATAGNAAMASPGPSSGAMRGGAMNPGAGAASTGVANSSESVRP